MAYDWSKSLDVHAPAWTGIVQKSFCVPGEQLQSGSVVALVDRIQRIAYSSELPFTRPLSKGDEGADVEELHRLLSTMAIANLEGAKFTARTEDAVGELMSNIGAGDGEPIFDPGWIVYLPLGSFPVATCSLTVGTSAPSAGETVATSKPQVASAIPTTSAYASSLDAVPSNESETETPSDVSAASEVPAESKLTLEDGETLLVADHELSVDPATGGITGDGLATLSTILQPMTPATPARAVSAAPEGSWIIPTETIVADSAGSTCVITGTDDARVPLIVEVVGYEPRGAIVLAALDKSSRVLVRPPSRLRSCN